tara:strand:+ start:704 stop:1222 length:519 start_codon:yes stop_codon:yes gene_type:complete
MISFYQIKKYFQFMIVLFLLNNIATSNENKLFWDGRDWNRITNSVDFNTQLTFKIKSAYLNGALDGRLNYYLKTWSTNNELADEVFSETVDYLTIRELIKNLDYFYQDPLNRYIPIPSAILIANMYAERVPVENIEFYIESTRRWINDLILNLDTLNYGKLLEDKLIKHNKN